VIGLVLPVSLAVPPVIPPVITGAPYVNKAPDIEVVVVSARLAVAFDEASAHIF